MQDCKVSGDVLSVLPAKTVPVDAGKEHGQERAKLHETTESGEAAGLYNCR